jgi:hypothetical protein
MPNFCLSVLFRASEGEGGYIYTWDDSWRESARILRTVKHPRIMLPTENGTYLWMDDLYPAETSGSPGVSAFVPLPVLPVFFSASCCCCVCCVLCVRARRGGLFVGIALLWLVFLGRNENAERNWERCAFLLSPGGCCFYRDRHHLKTGMLLLSFLPALL